MASKSKSDDGRLRAVLDVKKLHKDLDRDVLVKNLKELSVVLTDFKQTDQKKFPLTDVSSALVAPALFNHKSKEVRLFVACCLADVLRVYAPNPPYSVPQLKMIFDLFFDQLRGIANAASPSFPSYLYLLENFSLVNTPLLLVELESDEMLVKMFNLFFELTQKDLAPRIISYLQSILNACLTECENVSLRLLLAILINIVPPRKDESPAGYTLAHQLIRSDTVLDRPIANFIRDVVILQREPDEVEEEALTSPLLEDRATQLEVVYELCAHNSSIMIPLHPDLQDLMELEDINERLLWVDVFGRVFTAESTGLALKYPQLLLSFLKRFNDVDVNVRIKMAEYSHQLLVRHEAHREAICEHLQQRSLDKDDRVRKAVCTSVCGAARDKPTAVSLNLLNAIGKRTMDKKVPVRREAIEGMAQLFRVHCAEFWKNGEALPKVAKKFSWIPRKLILSLHLDTTMRMLVEKVLDEDMLDVKYTVAERTRCLIGIFASLEPRSKKAFLHLLQKKKFAQTIVNDLLDVQVELKKSDHDESATKRRTIRILELCKLFAEGDDDRTPKKMSDMFSSKDKHVNKWLRTLASPLSDYASLRLAQDELARAMSLTADKKTTKKKDSLAWHLSIHMAMTLLPLDSIPIIFKQAQENLANNRAILALAGLELATSLAEDFPSMMSQAGAVEALIPLAEADNEDVSRAALKVMALCPSGGVSKAVSSSAISMARERIFSGSRAQAKYATRIVCNLSSPEEGPPKKGKAQTSVASILKESLKALSLDDPATLEAAFGALGEVGQVHPSLVAPEFAKVVKFWTEELMPAPRESDNTDPLLSSKVAGMKAFTNFLLALAKDSKEEEGDSYKEKMRGMGAPFTREVFRIIKNQGNLTGFVSEDDQSREAEEKDAGLLVLTAAKCVLKLCSNPIFERQLARVPTNAKDPIKTYEPFLQLSLIAHHDQLEVRQRFIDYLVERISYRHLPFHYTCILALCASHETAEAKKIQGLLTRFITRQRQTWQMQQSFAGAKEKSIMNAHLPELVLSNLIYLLSYHPDFDDDDSVHSEADLRRIYDYFMEFPRFFLECLFSGKGAHDNNYTLISDILEVIRNSQDIRNPENVKIYKLAEMTRASLRDLYQGKDFSGSKHPGKIVLPLNLFEPRTSKPKLKYMPSWYSFRKGASAAAAAAPEVLAEPGEAQVAERKERPTTKKSRKAVANDAPATPTRTRLPRHAKEAAPKTLEYNSDEDSELDKLADDAAVPEEVVPEEAEDSEEEKPKKLRRTTANKETTSGRRTPARGKQEPSSSKKVQSQETDRDSEEDAEEPTNGRTKKGTKGSKKGSQKGSKKGSSKNENKGKAQTDEEDEQSTRSSKQTSSKKSKVTSDAEEETESVKSKTPSRRAKNVKSDDEDEAPSEQKGKESDAKKTRTPRRTKSANSDEEDEAPSEQKVKKGKMTPEKGPTNGKSAKSRSAKSEAEEEEESTSKPKSKATSSKTTPRSSKRKEPQSEDENEVGIEATSDTEKQTGAESFKTRRRR